MFSYRVEQDMDPANPRVDYDNAAVMACWHRRYDLGDDRKVWDCPTEPEGFVAWAEQTRAVYLPLYLYDHSGITMNTGGFSCQWDSGQVGYIYLTRSTIFKEWGWKVLTAKRLKFLEEYLRGEVKTYDQYLTGEVYGYIVEDEDANEIESCWGFYGEEYCEEEAKSVVAHLEAKHPKQHELNFSAGA